MKGKANQAQWRLISQKTQGDREKTYQKTTKAREKESLVGSTVKHLRGKPTPKCVSKTKKMRPVRE